MENPQFTPTFNIFVHSRLEVASSKLASLGKNKKAIKILSSHKYPVANPPEKFISTFRDLQLGQIDFNFNLQQVPMTNAADPKKNSDKLEFFHLRNRPQKVEKVVSPLRVKSVSSLITFINNENLIFSSANEKFVKETIHKAHDRRSSDFSRFSSLVKRKNDGLQYFPTMNEAPEIQLPQDLPDLAGIADDISFEQELQAPSLISAMKIVNKLPDLAELELASSSNETPESSSSETPMSVPEVPKLAVAPPPPPPPLPQMAIPVRIEQTTSAAVGKTSKAPAPAASDARSSLMDAIRNAGGSGKAKLRAAAIQETTPKAAAKKGAPPAGDLMSDLHAKLALRRRGIAGSKEAKETKHNPMMDKISSLIPAPAVESSGSSSNDDNSDWEP